MPAINIQSDEKYELSNSKSLLSITPCKSRFATKYCNSGAVTRVAKNISLLSMPAAMMINIAQSKP